MRARTLVGYKEFRSPAAGVILTKNFETDIIGPGAPITTLGKMDDSLDQTLHPLHPVGVGEARRRGGSSH